MKKILMQMIKEFIYHWILKALGDTLAWFPYVEEFGKVHKSKMIVSTFHNHMFENNTQILNL